MYTFRLTTANDLPSIMAIIREIQEDFRQAGIDQWQDGYPNEETFRADIENEESYVLLEDDRLVATAMITFRGEPTYNIIEGAWLTNEPYMVIHRIAVRPSLRGQRIANRIFDYAAQLCLQKGVAHQRIDTHKDNKAMQRVIERLGYTYCGIIYVRGGAARLAYEKEIANNIIK